MKNIDKLYEVLVERMKRCPSHSKRQLMLISMQPSWGLVKRARTKLSKSLLSYRDALDEVFDGDNGVLSDMKFKASSNDDLETSSSYFWCLWRSVKDVENSLVDGNFCDTIVHCLLQNLTVLLVQHN